LKVYEEMDVDSISKGRVNTKPLIENEEDLLPLSGIQHFAFCERQWGLIHVETQWAENLRTAEGRLLHQAADNPYFTESRDNVKTVRSVPLLSKMLGLYGVADVIELHRKTDDTTSIKYVLIEYKRGNPKSDDRDEVQLCAQAICLEEMLGITLEYGYMYYGETKHRHKVEFNAGLRERVKMLAQKMHHYFAKGETPFAVKDKKCKNCSMVDICLPQIANCSKKAGKYMSAVFEELEKEELLGSSS